MTAVEPTAAGADHLVTRHALQALTVGKQFDTHTPVPADVAAVISAASHFCTIVRAEARSVLRADVWLGAAGMITQSFVVDPEEPTLTVVVEPEWVRMNLAGLVRVPSGVTSAAWADPPRSFDSAQAVVDYASSADGPDGREAVVAFVYEIARPAGRTVIRLNGRYWAEADVAAPIALSDAPIDGFWDHLVHAVALPNANADEESGS